MNVQRTPITVFKTLAATPGLDDETYQFILNRFAKNVEILLILAKNPGVPMSVRNALLNHFIPEIASTALKTHLKTLLQERAQITISEGNWRILASADDTSLLTALTEFITGSENAEEFFDRASVLLEKSALSSRCVEKIYALAREKAPAMECYRPRMLLNKVAAHPAAPEAILRELYEERFSPKEVAAVQGDRIDALATNPSTPKDILLEISGYGQEESAQFSRRSRKVLANPSCPPEPIDYCISKDEASFSERKIQGYWNVGVLGLVNGTTRTLNKGLTRDQIQRLIRLSKQVQEGVAKLQAERRSTHDHKSLSELRYHMAALDTHLVDHPATDETLLQELLGGDAVGNLVRLVAVSIRAITPELIEKAVLKEDGTKRDLDHSIGLDDMTNGNLRFARELLKKPESSTRVLLALVKGTETGALLTEPATVIQHAAQPMMSMGSGDIIISPVAATPVGETYLWEALAMHPNADASVKAALRAKIEAYEIKPNYAHISLMQMQKKLALETL